jgi:hypothetical protein
MTLYIQVHNPNRINGNLYIQNHNPSRINESLLYTKKGEYTKPELIWPGRSENRELRTENEP